MRMFKRGEIWNVEVFRDVKLPAFKSEAATKKLVSAINLTLEARADGDPEPPQLRSILRNLEPGVQSKMVKRLVRVGILDEAGHFEHRPVLELLDEFIESMQHRKCDPFHVSETKRNCKTPLDSMGIQRLLDITSERFSKWLANKKVWRAEESKLPPKAISA